MKAVYILVLIFVLVVFAGIGIFFGLHQKNTPFLIKKGINQIAGSFCPKSPLFTASPININDLLHVVPLGHLNPPDHTIPTDHTYLTVKNTNQIIPDSAREVFAPGDITITTIQKTHVIRGGRLQSDDYSIDFSPCKEVRGKFGHITKLSSILSKMADTDLSCDTRKSGPADEATYCRKDLNFKIKAHELIGEAGGGSATGLDFQLVDRRSEKLNYANPKRYREDQLHYVCPLDYFDLAIKDSLYQKLGNNLTKRTIEPKCGEVNQDKLGTAQGNWMKSDGSPRFAGEAGLIDTPENWSKSIALVHDNIDASIGVVSIGGMITNPQRIQFNPSQTGNINREFSQVKPNGQIYCYEGRSIGQQQGGKSGRVLIELTSDTVLKAEYQALSCNESINFNSPTAYER